LTTASNKGDDDIYLTYQTSLNYLPQDIGPILLELEMHAKSLSNRINHELKISSNIKAELIFEKLRTKYLSHWRTPYLNQGTYQQLINEVIGNWKSFLGAQASQINPSADQHRIQLPPGNKTAQNRQLIMFVRKDINIDNEKIVLRLPRAIASKYQTDRLEFAFSTIWGNNYHNKEEINAHLAGLIQVRLLRTLTQDKWMLIIVYRIDTPLPRQDWKNVMAIDIGLNNLCAITFRYGMDSYLINGRPIKSKNQHLNYKIGQIQKEEMLKLKSSVNYRDTHQIRLLRMHQGAFINDQLHKVSKIVISLSSKYQCKIIVIGSLKGIKYHNTKRSFVQIPYNKLLFNIQYKAARRGIQTIFIDEAYTSQCSALDLEPVKRQFANPSRRISRGTFKTNNRILINSDINGSLNILRKFLDEVYRTRYLKQKQGLAVDLNGSIPELIQIARDKGFVMSPKKITLSE
jgi:putative transposase